MLNTSLTSVVSDDGEIYFKAKDVATTLGYGRPADAIDRHVWYKNKFEWCVIQRAVNSSPLKGSVIHGPLGERAPLPGFQPHTLFLTEVGVYQLIFTSKLPSAEVFQDWVFSEVLPSIRKTGLHSMNNLCNALGGMTLSVGAWRQEPANEIQNYPQNTREHAKRSCQGRNGTTWWIKVLGK